MRQGHLFVAFVLFLLAIPVSVVLIISFARMLERRSRSGPAVYLLALSAHTMLAVMFFRFTAGQTVGRIWWGLEIVLLATFTAVVSVPGVRKLALRLNLPQSGYHSGGGRGADVPAPQRPNASQPRPEHVARLRQSHGT
jgi:hypothetical protein